MCLLRFSDVCNNVGGCIGFPKWVNTEIAVQHPLGGVFSLVLMLLDEVDFVVDCKFYGVSVVSLA